MNPSSADIWSNPPPPGTEVEDRGDLEYDTSPKSRVFDEIDPYVKSPHYIDYEKHRSRSSHKRHTRSRSRERKHSRSRSRDRHRHKKERRRKSRSSSRSHHRRSRSKGRHHRHRSKSRSNSRHRHHKERRRKRSVSSSSRSSSRSPNHRSQHSKRKRSRSRRSRSFISYKTLDYDDKEACDTKPMKNPDNDDEEEEEETELPKENVFKNDGSFLEMFKKMQEEQQKAEAAKQEASSSETKKSLPVFGKRRGGRVLKTGMVQKTRTLQDNELENPQDAWSIYMKEVKKYKEACCDDDSKTRPLVK